MSALRAARRPALAAREGPGTGGMSRRVGTNDLSNAPTVGATVRASRSNRRGATIPRVSATLVIALVVVGCAGVAGEPAPVQPAATRPAPTKAAPTQELAPSGEPVELDHYGLDCSDSTRGSVEGTLLADAPIYNPMFESSEPVLTAIDLRQPDPSGQLVRVVPVSWPSEYRGVRLATGEVAIVDAAGNLVAMTGRDYRIEGLLVAVAAAGGPLFDRGESWWGGLTVCGSVSGL